MQRFFDSGNMLKGIKMKIFLTGGTGYIGSHTCVELLNNGYDVVIYDNLSNSSKKVLDRIKQITGKDLAFIEGDIRDEDLMAKSMIGCDAVIHFAGLKAVGESSEIPIEYYDNNINGTLCLLRAMKKNSIFNLVFSSSATVYGEPQYLPIDEEHPLSATNPYGKTKLFIEEILRDVYASDNKWHMALLRYFNPIGAHSSGLIGESPNGIPNNLLPYISQVAVKKREYLSIWGNDYDTIDGTGVRDYIHVVDLAIGHLKALENISKLGCDAINLGTGDGYSVLQIVKAFEKASNKNIPYKIQSRRNGDIASCYANSNKAKKFLNWETIKNIDDMCIDTWNWQSKNPNGYE